jgi:hypothetical protein
MDALPATSFASHPRRIIQVLLNYQNDVNTLDIDDEFIVGSDLLPIFYTMSAEVIHSRLVAILKTA